MQLAQAAKLGAGIVQLTAQLSPLGHDAFPRAVEARARWRAQRGAADRRRNRGRRVAPLFAPAMGLKKERGERGRRRAGLARFSAARHGEQMQVMSSFAASSQQHAVQCRRPSTKKWCESGHYQRKSRDQQQDKDQLPKAGFIQVSIEL